MSVAKAISKKRKRDSNPEAHFELSKPAPAKVGPILVSYPALQAPPATPFQCYSRKKSKRGGEDEEEFIVAGETDTVEFATNEDESRRASESGCRYLLAVHNTKTGTVSILPTPQTPHILSHTVKALKSIEPSAAPSKTAYLEAKTTLGETFGTKKQKAAIRANERNRIDVSAMEGVMGYVMDSIEKGAEGLMTAEESKEFADKNRLIPPFSMTAADPSDIYALHDIIPEAEWKALSIASLEAAGNYPERLAMLPYRRSQWVNHHLRVLTESTGKVQKKKLKILLYISAMLAFRQTTFQKTIDKEKLYERLSAVPGIVVDGLLSRFTEQARGSTSYHSTSATKTTLLTYTFALCLKVDDFASNTTVIAHDLSMTVTEVNQLFKSLGCKIVKLGDRDRAKLGLSDSSADEKRAVLTAPVEFPKPRLRKKT